MENRATDAAACTLPDAGLAQRMESWREVAGQAVSRRASSGRVVSTYPAEMRQRVEMLIAAEAECCPFLSFEVRGDDALVEVELRYPPDFEAMVTAITEVPDHPDAETRVDARAATA